MWNMNITSTRLVKFKNVDVECSDKRGDMYHSELILVKWVRGGPYNVSIITFRRILTPE